MISVIIPVYNVEKYLEKCIESVLNQTYKDLEIILIDDKSTDKSGEICDSFAKKSQQIKVIHKEKNEGLGYARNTGLEIATGEYVTFVDSDDYLEPNAIKDMHDTINLKRVDTCIGGFKRVTNDGKIIKEVLYNEEQFQGEKESINLLGRLIGSLPDKKDALKMSVWNCIYSMNIIKDHNIKFASEREYLSEDIFFDIDYYKYARSISVLRNSNYNYRVNQKSLTKSYRKEKFELSKSMNLKETELLKEMNLYEEFKYRLDRQFFIYTLSCIKQEKVKISKKTFKDAIKSIENICNDILLQNCISNYPINQLGIKQKIFLQLVKHKKAIMLYVLT